MKKSFILLFLLAPLFSYSTAFAVETAPRISDREIIEGLTTIRGDVKELRAEIKRLDEGQKASANELRASISGSVNELRTEIKRLDEGQKAIANELRASISGSVNELRTEIKDLMKGRRRVQMNYGQISVAV